MRIDVWYDFDHPVDQNGSDFRNVMAWLLAHGASPAWKLVSMTVGSPMVGFRILWLLAWPPCERSKGYPVYADLNRTMMDPGVTLREILYYYSEGNPDDTPLEYTPPATPPPPPIPLPVVTNPIGPPIGTMNGHPAFDLVFGDTRPVGAFYAPNGVGITPEYVKLGNETPFGMSMHWEQIL